MEGKATGADVPTSIVEVGPVLSQCAESRVHECSFYGYRAVCKHRFPKAYRHAVLDQRLREQRTVREGRALVRCRKNGVTAPTVFAVDREQCAIVMERIDGITIREIFNREQEKFAQGTTTGVSFMVSRLLRGMGEVVGLLHNADIIHGDLTTSNFMCKREFLEDKRLSTDESASKASCRDGIVVLDFGLVMDKNSAEERAVDLYVLERALKSSHPFLENVATSLVLEGYRRTVDQQKGAATITRLEAVRARGRKRSMIATSIDGKGRRQPSENKKKRKQEGKGSTRRTRPKMRGGTPAARVDAPMPRKPRPLPFLYPTSAASATMRREMSPMQRLQTQQESPKHSTAPPSKAIVFQRMHTPMVENSTLPEETLRALRQTRNLFLCCRGLFSFSQIRYLEHMTQLSSLNVHMNAISRIECLGHLHHLTELDVSANELRAVDEDAFKGLCHLKRLNLSSNFLTVVNGFQHLPALEWLSLSFNELEDVRGLRRLPCPQHLVHLDICGNKLSALAELESSLENCRDLQDLRVEIPKTTLVLPTAPPQLHLRENPFCVAEPTYAERLLQRFQKLVVLNGVTCGYDPTAETRPRERSTATNVDHDDQLCWHPLDATSPALVSSRTNSPQRLPEATSGDVVVTDVASENVACRVEKVASGSTSTTGPSSSDSPGNSNVKKNISERHSSSPAWRAKRVSRSVLTRVSIPLHRALHVSGVDEGAFQEELQAKDELIEHLELKFKRSQEQLSLRVALEEDLRRNFEDMRRSHVALVDSTTCEKKRLRRQVEALKDELSRRSEEAVILQRKNRVDLEEQAKALREDLLRQKKESAAAVKRLEEELARARREAANEIRELKTRLGDATQQNEWLEQQNEKTQSHLKKWRDEFHGSKRALIACETRLHFVDKQHCLQLEESLARRRLECVAWCDLVTATAAQLHLLRSENEFLVLCRENHQKAWEEYVTSLQQHYRDALLQSQAAQMTTSTGVDVGCDPIGEHVQQQTVDEEEMRRVQTALSLTRQSEQLLSVENERLLKCVADKECELADASRQLQQSEAVARKMKDDLERERDNLLRTLHNLREAIQKKDAEFDEMEAEAKLKIDEKRSTIARLETRLEDAEEEAANHRREAAKLIGVQEELRRVSAELQAVQQERMESAAQAAAARASHPHMADIMGALEETKEKLASSVMREHQQSLKLTRAAEALTLLRGQLARVDEDNSHLRKELDEKVALLRAADAEKGRLQAQLQEAQEAARVRQRATLQAISQIMVGDGDFGA